MTSPSLPPSPPQKNKYATKANKKIEYFELNKWFAPPCAFYISRYPLCQGRGACDPRRFYKPCPISRSKTILSNPHLLVITRSRIKLIGHFSFCNKFTVYTCHESVCIFLKRDCRHVREKDHHRDHWCNYIPVLTTIEDWHTRAYCHGPSRCLLLNMNSVIISTQ